MRRLLLLALFALGVAACGSSGPKIQETALSRLVLAQGDVRPLVQFDAGPQVRLDNIAGPRKDPQRFGREGGWKARFRRAGSASTAGPLVVESRADLFSAVSGAKRDLKAYEEDFREQAARAPTTSRFLQPPRLGDEAVAMTIRQPGIGLASQRFFRIAWREQNATASLLVQGFDGKIGFADALSLARRQERRIQTAAA